MSLETETTTEHLVEGELLRDSSQENVDPDSPAAPADRSKEPPSSSAEADENASKEPEGSTKRDAVLQNAFHQRNLAFIQRLAEQKKQREQEALLQSAHAAKLLARSRSVIVRSERSRRELMMAPEASQLSVPNAAASAARQSAAEGPGYGRSSSTVKQPSRGRERGYHAVGDSGGSGAEDAYGGAARRRDSGNGPSSSSAAGLSGEASGINPNPNAPPGKFRDLYSIYIQQLSEKKKKGREDEEQAKSRAIQNREKLKQQVLKKIQETRRRPWEVGSEDSEFLLPPIHLAGGSMRRSMDTDALDRTKNRSSGQDGQASGASTGPLSLFRRSVGPPNLSPYLPPATLTRMATGNALAIGGGVNLVDESSSNAQRSRDSGGAAASTSGAVCTLDKCFEGSAEYLVWKQRWRIPEGAQVFTLGPSGKHSEGVRAGLLRRGWIESPTPNLPYFNLMWSIKCGDIDFKILRQEQIVNHFQVASCITTKVGLLNSLRELPWFDSLDPDSFYPRAYDLFREDGKMEFLEDFRWTAAESLVKRVAEEGRLSGMSLSSLKLAVRVCESRVDFERDLVEEDMPWGADGSARPASRAQSRRDARQSDAGGQFFHFRLSEHEWAEVLSQPALRQSPPAKAMGLGPTPKSLEFAGPSPAPPPATASGAEGDAATSADDSEPQLGAEARPLFEGELDQRLLQRCRDAASDMERRLPQTHINGFNNVWIVKPSGKSRGRGIRLFNQLPELMRYIGPDSTEAKWIVQKYIEQPMLAHRRRKFDFRQWVLVTGWNPITCYFYSEAYVRFAATDYDPTDLGLFAHLSNNSIVKDYEGYKKGDEPASFSSQSPPIHDFLMWSQDEFRQFLRNSLGSDDAWNTKIQPAMKAIVRATLRCATDMVKTRSNSVQLYGYDFMLDDALDVWLLEINASPTMEASTPVTSSLCAEVQEDILRVIVDFPQYRAAKKAEKRRQKRIKQESREAAAANGASGAGGAAPGSPSKRRRAGEGPGSAGEGQAEAAAFPPILEDDAEGEEDEEDEEGGDDDSSPAPPPPAASGAAPLVMDASSVVPSAAAAWRPPKPEYPEFNLGKWELILRDKVEVKAPKYTGLNLELVGTGYKPGPRAPKPPLAGGAAAQGPLAVAGVPAGGALQLAPVTAPVVAAAPAP